MPFSVSKSSIAKELMAVTAWASTCSTARRLRYPSLGDLSFNHHSYSSMYAYVSCHCACRCYTTTNRVTHVKSTDVPGRNVIQYSSSTMTLILLQRRRSSWDSLQKQRAIRCHDAASCWLLGKPKSHVLSFHGFGSGPHYAPLYAPLAELLQY